MKVLSRRSVLVCPHETGIVGLPGGDGPLTASDLRGRPIVGCVNVNPAAGFRPCTSTLSVESGFAGVLGEDGSPLLLDSVTGYTDGSPPGTHRFKVRQPRYVEVEAPDDDR